MVTRKVFFEISIGGQPKGRVVFGLFGDTVPITVRNFAELCTGENGLSRISNTKLSYENSIFYSITNQIAYGGDINFNNGTGGESIFGLTFNDENFILQHRKKYLLSMTNSGAN
jgi:cyclophilin family peptidyl-prolyl cis-trans isomerase